MRKIVRFVSIKKAGEYLINSEVEVDSREQYLACCIWQVEIIYTRRWNLLPSTYPTSDSQGSRFSLRSRYFGMQKSSEFSRLRGKENMLTEVNEWQGGFFSVVRQNLHWSFFRCRNLSFDVIDGERVDMNISQWISYFSGRKADKGLSLVIVLCHRNKVNESIDTNFQVNIQILSVCLIVKEAQIQLLRMTKKCF